MIHDHDEVDVDDDDDDDFNNNNDNLHCEANNYTDISATEEEMSMIHLLSHPSSIQDPIGRGQVRCFGNGLSQPC